MSRRILEKEICKFVAYLKEEERSAATVEKYRREVARFAAWLEHREVSKEAAVAYKSRLSGVRTAAGVNGAVSALN